MNLNKQSVYLQIVEDIKRRVGLGLLGENEKLPSCRELALQIGVNPNTVQRAYSELEAQGIIYTLPKKGVYVSAADKKAFLNETAEKKIGELKQAGISRGELIKIIDSVYGENYD